MMRLVLFFALTGVLRAEPTLEAVSAESGMKFDLGKTAAEAVPSGRRGHDHYWQGIKETSPENVVSKASLIRHAGASGHLINALPPVALAGAGRWWVSAIAGEQGRGNRLLTRTATILLPVGIFMAAALAAAVIVDNLWDALEDAVMGRFRID